MKNNFLVKWKSPEIHRGPYDQFAFSDTGQEVKVWKELKDM